ncbi:MAG: DnaJ domain-containing protein, partial [Acidobacteria bacterium]|nr:DnaJ domain-containing protein [Acidobacteriota bacterium]
MVTRDPTNYYQRLGVTSLASTSEVVAAFRKLARRFHPNVNPGDPAAEK